MKPSVIKKLDAMMARMDELDELLSDPDVLAQTADRYQKLSIEHVQLRPVVLLYKRWVAIQQELADLADLADLTDVDAETKAMAVDEIAVLETESGVLVDAIQMALLSISRKTWGDQ